MSTRETLQDRLSGMSNAPFEIIAAFEAIAGSRDPESVLEATLGVALRLLNGRLGYAAVGRPEAPSWSALVAKGDEEGLRARVSVSVQRLVHLRGQGLVTPLAWLDPLFDDSKSARTNQVQSVVCAPLTTGETMGLLYVEGRVGTTYTDEDLRLLEGLARFAAVIVRRLLTRTTSSADPTTRWRSLLKADAVVGRSAALAKVLESLALVARAHVPVLLVGPTGTGKTTLARVLHDSSPRAKGPFVHVNCAELPRDLVVAELFGAKRGAATGIDRDRPGLVHAAEGGTLFLDEIGTLERKGMEALLTFVETRRFKRLGDVEYSVSNVRIVAACLSATDIDEPLMQRLSKGGAVVVPSLAERREDIPLIVQERMQVVAAEYGVPALPLDDDAMEELVHRDWSGNVRDLENVIGRGLLRAHADQSSVIRLGHVSPHAAPSPLPTASETLGDQTERFRRQVVIRAIERHHDNKTKAAEALGISRTMLYRILGREAPLADPEEDPPTEANGV